MLKQLQSICIVKCQMYYKYYKLGMDPRALTDALLCPGNRPKQPAEQFCDVSHSLCSN